MTHYTDAFNMAYAATAAIACTDSVLCDNAAHQVAGVGVLESDCGRGWHGAGRGSNNIGAIQAGSSWTGDTFVYTDTSPNPDGSSTPYVTRFRKYPTLAAGWEDLVRVMFSARRRSVLIAARMGDTYSVSWYLRKTGYYEGFGPTIEDRVRNHYLALRRGIWVVAFDRSEELPEGTPNGMSDTVRRGDRGPAVRTLQSEMRIAADGIFGPITERYVRGYQDAQELVVDGVVGPITWRALFTDGYVP